MKLQPLADRIVATPIEAATKTASGLLLPDSAKENPQAAKVTAVGSDIKGVKVGDQVLHSGGYDVKTLKIDNQEYLIMKEEEVLAVVKE